ncbi:class II aldolase/adducin family protein [Thalassotalea sp. HSM 43]|uniref:class II aldolase/adducin family protein n=1 Tax=Thalassotalea sp. HSM 43 TaxID=2552945 RepID=UPI0010811B38|nr:class II aldolase/adducin family protein [Thalassotalea sp. HSM 43]QBY03774.1 class II aldolase/adducin family protein [Thalassotalea sp. HSM 43]
MYELVERNLQTKVSDIEWQTRLDLAACYRLVADMGWDDLIYTHISARIGDSEEFLINAFGVAFDEVTASNLVKIDIDGNILDGGEFQINPAGFTIHSAIHQVRHDAACVLHLHTPATIAVASQRQGLLPVSQYAMFSLPSLSYHDYEGLAVNPAEKQRLQHNLDNNNHLLLRNHGGLTLGPSIADAFMRFYDLNRACEIQLQLQASGQELINIPQHIIDNIFKQANIVHSGKTGGQKAWPAMMRKAYRLDPGFAK